MQLTTFQTARLVIQHCGATISDRTARKELEGQLSTLLTDAVLSRLPAALHAAAGPDWTSKWIDERANESDIFLVHQRQAGNLIGLLFTAEITTQTGVTDTHIGYLIAEDHRNHGYGTELVLGLVKAMKPSRTSRILAGVGLDNFASTRVLRKAGFERDAKLSTACTNMYVFKADT